MLSSFSPSDILTHPTLILDVVNFVFAVIFTNWYDPYRSVTKDKAFTWVPLSSSLLVYNPHVIPGKVYFITMYKRLYSSLPQKAIKRKKLTPTILIFCSEIIALKKIDLFSCLLIKENYQDNNKVSLQKRTLTV